MAAENDIAVIEFCYGGEWKPWAYVGPDRSGDCTYPTELVGITGVRVRYLSGVDTSLDSMPLGNLNLSTRAHNALHLGAGMDTVGDIRRHILDNGGFDSLQEFRNIGSSTQYEIMNALEEEGVDLDSWTEAVGG